MFFDMYSFLQLVLNYSSSPNHNCSFCFLVCSSNSTPQALPPILPHLSASGVRAAAAEPPCRSPGVPDPGAVSSEDLGLRSQDYFAVVNVTCPENGGIPQGIAQRTEKT